MAKNIYFKTGVCYSRDEIFVKLGGSKQSYLPMKDGRVLYGAFRKDLNPDAPRIILPGKGSIIENSAYTFARQRNPIPVFIKHGRNKWKYVGEFLVNRLVTKDMDVIEEHKRKSKRTDISMVLHLQGAG
jgi:hypothetical protein